MRIAPSRRGRLPITSARPRCAIATKMHHSTWEDRRPQSPARISSGIGSQWEAATFTATIDGTPYRCSISDSTCRKAEVGPRVGAGLGVGRRAREEGPRLSPDGQWEALVDNYNVAIRQVGGRTLTNLSTDGSE